jgi:hypothetical protein
VGGADDAMVIADLDDSLRRGRNLRVRQKTSPVEHWSHLGFMTLPTRHTTFSRDAIQPNTVSIPTQTTA